MLTAVELEQAAVEVSRLAADVVRSVAGRATAVQTKSSRTDIVTSTDLRAEQLIRQELGERVPDSSFIGEEYPAHNASGDVTWVIDPIDGTVNFLYDLPVVAISIAAQVEGETVAAAVSDVLRGETFSAGKGLGARHDGQVISANGVGDLDVALVATGYSYDAAKRTEQAVVVSRVLPAARDIRSMGSAALQLCWVGCGRLDAYYERDLKPWDIAAGLLVAEEARASVERPSGSNNDLTFAAAPGIFTELRSLL